MKKIRKSNLTANQQASLACKRRHRRYIGPFHLKEYKISDAKVKEMTNSDIKELVGG